MAEKVAARCRVLKKRSGFVPLPATRQKQNAAASTAITARRYRCGSPRPRKRQEAAASAGCRVGFKRGGKSRQSRNASSGRQ
ncbi:hypothetical protein HT118_07105 [Escherichia coli]|nr:hypothetical protein [Escherichia coli]